MVHQILRGGKGVKEKGKGVKGSLRGKNPDQPFVMVSMYNSLHRPQS